MTRRRTLALAASLALCVSCASDPLSPHKVAGCYLIAWRDGYTGKTDQGIILLRDSLLGTGLTGLESRPIEPSPTEPPPGFNGAGTLLFGASWRFRLGSPDSLILSVGSSTGGKDFRFVPDDFLAPRQSPRLGGAGATAWTGAVDYWTDTSEGWASIATLTKSDCR